MKVLQICSKSPFPPKEGAPIAMNAIACGLVQAGVDVTILTFTSNKESVKQENIPLSFKKNFFTTTINPKITAFRFFLHIFSKKSLQIQRFVNDEFRLLLIEILTSNTFDVIQLETIYVASYIETIRAYSQAKVVLRAHNIEHLIWDRMAELHHNIFKKMYFNRISKRLKRFEISVISKVDAVVTITAYDFDRFRMLGFVGNMLSVPYGVDVGKIHYTDFGQPEIPSFCHIGDMSSKSNQNGLYWFLNNVWNLIHIQYPDVKFYIAGRNIPRWIKKKYRKRTDVEIVGEVPNAYEFIRSKGVLIVPLMSGSGIRIKIIEGMACGRPVLTTSIGAEGIVCENKKNISIANTPAQFFDAIENYINHPEIAETIGMEAQKLIREKYNNKDLIQKLIAFYETVLKN